jgi:hypothetical protein
METKLAIPDWLVFVAGFLTPKNHRDFIRGDLLDLCESPLEYVQRAARYLAGVFGQRIRESSHVVLWIGEVVGLVVPVWKTTLLRTAVFAGAVTLFLRLYDVYTENTEGTSFGMAIDAVTIAAFAALLEFGLASRGSAFALSPQLICQGAVLGGILTAGWRTAFRHRDPSDPRIRTLKESYIASWHMNVLFIVAAIPIILTNAAAVPDHGNQRDPILAALPLIMMALSYRFQTGHGLFKRPRIEEYEKNEETGILKKWLRRVWAPQQPDSSGLPEHVVCEIIYFGALFVALPIAIGRWASGDPSARETDWRQAALNFAAVAGLLVLWIRIKKMNRELHQALRLEIDRRGGVGTK